MIRPGLTFALWLAIAVLVLVNDMIGDTVIADRLLLAVDAPGDWRAALAMARSWTPPELPVSGGDALKLGLKPGPKVGALIETVERWWIDGDFAADRTACLAELERLARTAQ